MTGLEPEHKRFPADSQVLGRETFPIANPVRTLSSGLRRSPRRTARFPANFHNSAPDRTNSRGFQDREISGHAFPGNLQAQRLPTPISTNSEAPDPAGTLSSRISKRRSDQQLLQRISTLQIQLARFLDRLPDREGASTIFGPIPQREAHQHSQGAILATRVSARRLHAGSARANRPAKYHTGLSGRECPEELRPTASKIGNCLQKLTLLPAGRRSLPMESSGLSVRQESNLTGESSTALDNIRSQKDRSSSVPTTLNLKRIDLSQSGQETSIDQTETRTSSKAH